MINLTKQQGAILLKIARTAIGDRLGEKKEPPQYDDPVFEVICGTFVTLKLKGQLRGCIGNIEPVWPLADGVHENALNAAFNDYRFSPLSLQEFKMITISVSVLTPAKPLSYAEVDELQERLRPGVDGVILRQGRNSATFLPQVWDQLPDTELFLGHLCLKAGLSRECWKTGDIEMLTYQVQNFSEEQQ